MTRNRRHFYRAGSLFSGLPPKQPAELQAFRTARSAIGIEAADVRRRWGAPEFGFEHRNPRLQRLVFLSRQTRHVLDGLKFLALDHVQIAQDSFGLIADHR